MHHFWCWKIHQQRICRDIQHKYSPTQKINYFSCEPRWVCGTAFLFLLMLFLNFVGNVIKFALAAERTSARGKNTEQLAQFIGNGEFAKIFGICLFTIDMKWICYIPWMRIQYFIIHMWCRCILAYIRWRKSQRAEERCRLFGVIAVKDARLKENTVVW